MDLSENELIRKFVRNATNMEFDWRISRIYHGFYTRPWLRHALEQAHTAPVGKAEVIPRSS